MPGITALLQNKHNHINPINDAQREFPSAIENQAGTGQC